ncbi:hypothetical protein FJT64_026043 [Amphibalanus amphitrite]|uniref:Uncharacterized protein n=1 Tax=Amphibalanus amphitrite TaxID=1232801 RepID=A0A6A4W6V3_AMPAM|nr:hypothetical protein FJT64_026043 [Amphibalanus amphitrite]
MADDNVKRFIVPKSNLSPLLLVGLLHYVAVRVYLFFAPLITRTWRVYLQTLRALTLPYQCCCTVMLFTMFWPFLLLAAWFYTCIRLWEYYGFPIRAVPAVEPLMGPLDVRENPPVRRTAVPARPAAAAPGTSASTSVAVGGARRRTTARAPTRASTSSQSSTGVSQADPGEGPSGLQVEGAAAAPPAEGEPGWHGSEAARRFRERTPDGWFGPPPPEEGGPEPPYVPHDPNFVDPTDYLPAEELAKYKIYKRRTPYRRVP